MALNITAANIITISDNTSYVDYICNMNLWPHFTGINKDFVHHFTFSFHLHRVRATAFFKNDCFKLLQSLGSYATAMIQMAVMPEIMRMDESDS